MRMRYGVLAAALLAFTAVSAQAQSRTVTGTVRAHHSAVPIPEVSVRLRGAIASVQTDNSGTFRIEVPAGSTDILVLTHPAYDLAEVELLGRSSVDVTMISNVRLNQYGVPVPRVPVAGEARDGILVFESADGSYKLWYDLRVQMDGAAYFGDLMNETGNGVEMRRARIAMKSEFAERWYAEIDMDFADSRADLKDAYVMYSVSPSLDVRAGNFKEIFSLETNTTSRYLTFMERPMAVKALTPSRHAGFQAMYRNEFLAAAAGLHFQDVGGWEEVQNRKDNNSATGANEGYSLTGKIALMPIRTENGGLHLGIAGSYRTPKTTDRIDAVRFDIRGPTNVNRRKYIDTDRIVNVESTVLTGLEAAAYHGAFRVQGEYDRAKVTRKDGAGTEEFSGFYVMGSTFLFGGRHRYNTHEAEFTQPTLGARPFGDVELGLRYDYIDLNSSEAVMGGSGEAITVGLNYYPNANVKLTLNYAMVNNDRWANQRGSAFVGRDAAGELTKNPLMVADPTGKAGEDYSTIGFRVQVSF